MTRIAHACLLPFNAERINSKYLVSNRMGCWDALDEDEFRQLNSLKVLKGGKLFDRLRERGMIVDENNIRGVLQDYRSLNANLFYDTSLHIAVVTKRCNLRCSYCHAEGGASSEDMSLETAARVLQYLFDVRHPTVTLEFQGGEPLLNWPVVKFLVHHARQFNTLGKKIYIVLVTNLLLMDDEKMRFLVDHDVTVCTSLDGPADIHDKYRKYVDMRGSYAPLVDKINHLKKIFGRPIPMLPTITKYALSSPERIIDEYVRLGAGEIALRPVNKIGYACSCFDDIGYSAEAFNDFYTRAMRYIMQLNTSGTYISERVSRTILTKVLLKRDGGYVDMMTLSGAARAVMAYAPDGSCYPTDEARMLGDKIFRLGNIHEANYDQMVNNENLVYLLSAGYSDLWNYASVYSPWLGIDPVVNYAVEKNVIPKGSSRLQQILKHQFKTVFSYLLDEDKKYGEVFQRWVKT